MLVNLNVSKDNFNTVYLPYLKDISPLQIFFGGSSSGKSVFVAQRAVLEVCSGGHNYLCVRNVKATIRNSQFNEICKVIGRFKLLSYFHINHSDLFITCANGYQILFAGLDDVEKIKSITPKKGVITDIWIEEATEVALDDVRQLQRRLRGHSKVSKKTTLSFNPILKSHWIFKEYFGYWVDSKNTFTDGIITILKTTYKDNLRFLDQQDIALLENETDKYYYEVYTLGNWGVLGNLIFKNWETADLTEQKAAFNNYKNGLDFGFAMDPAAMIRTHYDKKNKTIYITDEIYEKELTNDLLADMVKKVISKEYIVCDSAEPKSIRDFRIMGVNSLAARKGKDSVNFGIDWLQRQKIIIDYRCQNFKNEIQQYKWKEDHEGTVMKVPASKNDHLLDALRYAYEDEMESRRITAERAII